MLVATARRRTMVRQPQRSPAGPALTPILAHLTMAAEVAVAGAEVEAAAVEGAVEGAGAEAAAVEVVAVVILRECRLHIRPLFFHQ